MRLPPAHTIARKRPSSSLLAATTKLITTSRPLATQINHSAAFREDHDKERVVILGSGWGGYNLSRQLSPDKYNSIIISPRSYFVFTPLLTDAAGGSLDFSHIVEPIRDRSSKVDFIQAAARSVNFAEKTITCEATVVKSGVTETPRSSEDEEFQSHSTQSSTPQRPWETGQSFTIPYDKLIIAVGTVSKTFNTPGVRENALFFKDVGDARKVRRRLRECFELAVLPTTSPELRKHLLHFAIVGAGPTGTELAASLRDFITQDLIALYPALKGIPRITLYDIAPKVLSMFDEKLSQYAMDTMRKEGIEIKTAHHVQSLRWGEPGASPPYEMDPKRCLTLSTEEEGEVGVGMCVWATGNAMNKFIRDSLTTIDTLPTNSALLNNSPENPTPPSNTTWHVKKHPKTGALLVDGHLRVQLQTDPDPDSNDTSTTATLHDVFALGDNAMPETGAPPATAQATFQEAKWLAARLNKGDFDSAPPFSFLNLGTLAYIGDANALMQIPHQEGGKGTGYLPEGLTGRMAWVVWNSAYLTMSISWRNKLRVGFRWLLNRMFGRDVSRY